MCRIIDWIGCLCERGPLEEDGDPHLMQALDRAFAPEPDGFADSWLHDFKNKDRLNQELANAEWILNHEKRLISLQKKTAAQRSRAEQVGANTDRLRRLEHHLAGLRRNLSLDNPPWCLTSASI